MEESCVFWSFYCYVRYTHLRAHILYAYAADVTNATSINTGSGICPVIGNIKAYAFTVLPAVEASYSPVGSIFPTGTTTPAANISFSSISGTALISAICVDRTGTSTNTDVPTASLRIGRNKNNIYCRSKL